MLKKTNSVLFKNYLSIIKIPIITMILLACTIQTGQPAEEVTSEEVFATMELANRTLDGLLEVRKIKEVKDIEILEKGLKAMHVYQMLVATTDMMIELEKKENIRPMPKIVATPMEYIPEDVKLVADILLNEMHRVLYSLKIYDYPMYSEQFSDKTPDDVFKKILSIFVKLNALIGKTITPTEIFQQMVRGISDVKSILSHIDPAQRFRIDAPISPDGLKPADVFRKCIQIRKELNSFREHFNMEVIPVPEVDENVKFYPADVFIQTQIIIAELNLLKMRTNTMSATPLPIPVSEKVPSDVHQQAVMLEYLLEQIKPLQEMVEMGRTK